MQSRFRVYKKESADAIAHILGYKYASSYCKLERGEVHELNFESLLKLCEHFKINFLTLLLLIEIDTGHEHSNIIPLSYHLYDYLNIGEKKLVDEITRIRNQSISETN